MAGSLRARRRSVLRCHGNAKARAPAGRASHQSERERAVSEPIGSEDSSDEPSGAEPGGAEPSSPG